MILIVVLVAIPVAAIAFIANAGNAFKSIGKGGLSVEFESDMPQGMRDSGAEAEAPRRRRRTSCARCSRRRPTARAPAARTRSTSTPSSSGCSPSSAPAPRRPTDDPALREEVRQLVVARNERRARQGKEPLDVEAEVDRQLRELENLGQ